MKYFGVFSHTIYIFLFSLNADSYCLFICTIIIIIDNFAYKTKLYIQYKSRLCIIYVFPIWTRIHVLWTISKPYHREEKWIFVLKNRWTTGGAHMQEENNYLFFYFCFYCMLAFLVCSPCTLLQHFYNINAVCHHYNIHNANTKTL